MKRVVYSIYIDVPEKEHYATNFDFEINQNKERAEITRQGFKTHYNRLKEVKKDYAEKIGADFLMYEYDSKYKDFLKQMNYKELTEYELVNFYKIYLLDKLANEYDEILYLDFDAIPVTDENFFEFWDLTKGVVVLKNDDQIRTHKTIQYLKQSTRSPTAKFYNAQAMLLEKGKSPTNNVINTGIIGISKKHVKQLKYFDNFKETIDLMTHLINDKDSMYPDNVRNMFRYDNETIFSYKIKMNDVPVQWFDEQWHYFFSQQLYIPRETKIVHCVCKDFDTVWRFYDKINF